MMDAMQSTFLLGLLLFLTCYILIFDCKEDGC